MISRMAPEKDVFADAQLRHERQLLVNKTDSERPPVGGSLQFDGNAVPEHGSAVPRQDSTDDVHQGRLSRPIRSGERVHFARPDIKGHVAKNRDATEALPDLLDAKHGYRRYSAAFSLVTRVSPVSITLSIGSPRAAL